MCQKDLETTSGSYYMQTDKTEKTMVRYLVHFTNTDVLFFGFVITRTTSIIQVFEPHPNINRATLDEIIGRVFQSRLNGTPNAHLRYKEFSRAFSHCANHAVRESACLLRVRLFSPQPKYADGQFALGWVLGKNKDAMKRFVRRSAHSDFRGSRGALGDVLQMASADGSVYQVELLLESGADVNRKMATMVTRFRRRLQEVAENNVRMLLERGADVHAKGGSYGNSLLKHGANTNAKCTTPYNALYTASACGHRSIVQMLLRHGARVNDEAGHHGSALQAAIVNDQHEVAKLLMEHGASLSLTGQWIEM